MAIDKIESAGLETSTNQPNFRNIIINGDMSIAQRATSQASVTTAGYYTIDRMQWIADYGTVTLSQDTDVPTGQGLQNLIRQMLLLLEQLLALVMFL